MKPIIKWSGGKSQEIKSFKHKYPEKYKRYIEPFIGGGGVYFDLEHNKSIINDVNYELISFYKIINDEKQRKIFIEELELINNQRNEFNNHFNKYSEEEIIDLYNQKITKEKDFIFTKEYLFLIKDKELLNLIQKSIKDKIKRVKDIESKENKKFNKEKWIEHLTTSLQSALYFYCRNIYNKGYKGIEDKIPYYIANWYYVREFCYSSMFRFSNNGNFNVPYGGIGYNKKDFSVKIENIKNNEILHNLLQETEINRMDFEELFEKYNYFTEEDFIFLDPPYDSEFSQYNKEKDFDKIEQIRLRDCLLKTKAKIMVVIKETDFINSLYEKDFTIEKFDKKYMTNMRNRNNKDVQHLIITNY